MVTLTLPNVEKSRILLGMVQRDNPGAELKKGQEWLTVSHPKRLVIRREAVELVYGKQVKNAWDTLLAMRQGIVRSTEDDVTLYADPEDVRSQRGWHILVDEWYHSRWSDVAEALGLSKKALTTVAMEMFIRDVYERDPDKAENLVAEFLGQLPPAEAGSLQLAD